MNANVRNDRSNRFGQDTNRTFDPTYSFGLAWRLSDEPWMKRVNKVITNANFKATFGIQGNANLNISPDLILTQEGIQKPFEDFASSIKYIPNPNLTWERTKTWNFGLDLSLFDRVNFNVDYYRRRSNAVITQVIPYMNGNKDMKSNGGILYNSGAEISVTFAAVQKRDFVINVNVNSSRNWNKGGRASKESGYKTYLTGRSSSILKEGYPINSFWSYDYAGLDGTTGQPTFRDFDVDPELAKRDPSKVLVYTGPNEPDFTGGLNLTVRYKKLTLRSGFTLLIGGYRRLDNPYQEFSSMKFLPSALVNLNKDLNNRWKKPGDEAFTDIPSIGRGQTIIATPYGGLGVKELYQNSSALTVSSSFFRCRNINLSYNLDGQALKKIGFNSLQIGASVNNLFVIASDRYNGFDPELGNSVRPKGYSLSLSFGF